MTDVAHPRVSRRREVSHASARSVLMTVLGEYVLPRDAPVWTSTLVAVLAMFGIEEKSARQALSRTAAEGWLESERVGRRVRWSLTKPGYRLLSEGAHRIYEFGRGQETWDGRWLMLFVSVPESQRDLRHRLRTRLAWAGFGSPQPGVWVSPNTRRQVEAAKIVADLGVETPVTSFLAEHGEIGAEADLVTRAWDLSGLEERYEDFIDEFSAITPPTAQNALHAQTLLVHEWRRFPFLDPGLPARLLPANWSGAKAADLFHRKHDDWRADSQRHWEAVMA
ncbi:MAG: PaaX family transcriptional regulator C-terminal domain-containing protein [Umezawaea sp.]